MEGPATVEPPVQTEDRIVVYPEIGFSMTDPQPSLQFGLPSPAIGTDSLSLPLSGASPKLEPFSLPLGGPSSRLDPATSCSMGTPSPRLSAPSPRLGSTSRYLEARSPRLESSSPLQMLAPSPRLGSTSRQSRLKSSLPERPLNLSGASTQPIEVTASFSSMGPFTPAPVFLNEPERASVDRPQKHQPTSSSGMPSIGNRGPEVGEDDDDDDDDDELPSPSRPIEHAG